ncbi:hypothetical protein J6590_027827, partial [Homalodisca vitripennis]
HGVSNWFLRPSARTLGCSSFLISFGTISLRLIVNPCYAQACGQHRRRVKAAASANGAARKREI